jgi:hypothetical protein
MNEKLSKLKDIIKRITDVASIVFPAVMAVFGVLHLTGVVEIMGMVEQITLIALGAVSSISSVVYNWASKA